MAGIEKIWYKEKEILYIDYQGMDEAEMISALNQAEEIIFSSTKPILLLSNAKGLEKTPELIKATSEFGRKTKPFVAKNAILGTPRTKEVEKKGGENDIELWFVHFNTEHEAKEYLVKD